MFGSAGIGGICSFSGMSATTPSVVSIIAAMLAAFCNVDLATLSGQQYPFSSCLSYSARRASNPTPLSLFLELSTTIEPSYPAFCGNLSYGFLECPSYYADTDCFISSTSSASNAGMALINAVPPPGMIPSSTAVSRS